MQRIKIAAQIALVMVGLAAGTGGAFAQSAGGVSQTANASPGQTAAVSPAVSKEALQAFRTLETVPYFAMGGVGRAGQTSPGEKALRVLLEQKNPETLLRGLLKTANPAGKLYALLGYKQVGGANALAQTTAGLSKTKTLVPTRRGCLGGNEKMAVVIARIKKGYYQWNMDNPKK